MTPLLADLASWWLQAGLLLGAGLVLPPLLRLRDADVRLRIGQALLAAALLLPFLPRAVPASGITGPGFSASFALSLLVTPDPSPALVSFESLALALLAAGVALRLAWLGAGALRLRALRRTARPLLPDPPAVASARARTGVDAPVLLSPEVASPVTIGWRRPAVLLPEDLGGLEGAELEAVVCHELLHVRRRDAWAVLLEEGARALLWAQPAAWGVLSEIALAREEAVDRAVVASTGTRRPYLRALTLLALRDAGAPVAALPFHPRSHLHRRVARLVKEAPMSRTRLVLATAGAAALILLVGAAAASAFPLGVGPSPAAPAVSVPHEPGNAAPAGKDEVLKVGGEVKEPVVKNRDAPAYPEEARKNKVQGSVILSVVVDGKGNVAKVETVESPDPMLAEAAIEAVKKWTYEPATLKGKPVKVQMKVTVTFKLQ